MKQISLCIIAAVFAAGAACAGQDTLRDMELRLETGVVNVIRDGETINVEDSVELRPGDVIVSKEKALAKFALEGGADAREGEIHGNTRLLVRSASSVEAQEGQVLMRVSENTRVLVDGVTAQSSQGTFRVDRRFGSVRTAAYTGSLQLDAPGQTKVRLPRLYQATIVAGALPNQTRPYQLDLDDPWDKTLLDKVVTLEKDLVALSRGFSGQLGRDRPGLNYFSALQDGRDVGFMRRYLSRKPFDLLIGFTIAQYTDRPLRSGFEKAFELFDAGARWGVAAEILEVELRPMVAELEDLILGTGVVAANGRGGDASFDLAAANAGESGGEIAPPTSPSDPGGSDNPAPPGGGTDPQDPDEPDKPGGGGGPDKPDEPDECSDGAECTVEEIEDELFPDEEPSPSPTNEQKNVFGGGD